MFCSHCGALNEDYARFCGVCGTKLAVQPPIAPQDQPYRPAQQVQTWPGYPYGQAPRLEKLPGKGFGIAGLVVSLVALALGTAWILSAVLGVLGIIFSAIALAKAKHAEKNNGLAVGGLVCGIVALVIVAFFVAVTLLMIDPIPDPGLDYSVYM